MVSVEASFLLWILIPFLPNVKYAPFLSYGSMNNASLSSTERSKSFGTLQDDVKASSRYAFTSFAGKSSIPSINAPSIITSSCKVPKDLLLSVLDRLALFIEPYDKNGAYFTFGRKGINIHSKKDASTETINYVESKDFAPFVCCVDIPMLKEQLQANPDDTVKICYGNENALKIESGKVTQVIALLEDEELENMTE